ncbi:MAG: hypothetical protein HQM08_09890 [Candidatus Riflebacteria bacterium]|nr:hypothetical protein [Candidatus Riflebacteria bacterium]
MNRIFSFVLIFLVIVSCFCPMNANAWGPETHKKMTSDAFFIMPLEFRKFLCQAYGDQASKAYELLIESCNEPDRILKDFRNHIFHIHGSSMGNGPVHVEELAKEIVDDIKAKKPINQIIQKLGWVAHYIEDLANPLHTGISTEEGIEEKSYHSTFEKDVDQQVLTLGVNFDGANPVQRISARMVYEALWANQYYDKIQEAFSGGKRYEDTKQVVALCYSRGVNNLVDIWYTIWVDAGGKIDPKRDTKPRFYPPLKKLMKDILTE